MADPKTEKIEDQIVETDVSKQGSELSPEQMNNVDGGGLVVGTLAHGNS
jgi:hypothetical protein